MEEIIKSYKGFNKDMTCKDKQYEVGKDYEEDNRQSQLKRQRRIPLT